jgi:tetratricopeptide (TPR) repeat protein
MLLVAAVCFACLQGCETVSDLFSAPAQMACGEALGQMRIGKYGDALACLDRAIRLNSRDDASFYYRGICHVKLNQFDSAIKDFSQAIGLRKSRIADQGVATLTPCLDYRSYCYIKLGEYDKARTDLEEAISGSPSVFTYCLLCAALEGQSNFQRVLDIASHGISIVKLRNDQRYLKAPLYEARALAYNRLGKYAQALTDCNQAIADANTQDVAKSFEPFALEVSDCYDPTLFRIFTTRAYANLMLKRPDRAIADCEAAIRNTPTDAEAYYYRALAYEQIGKPDLAKKDKARAKELGYKA